MSDDIDIVEHDLLEHPTLRNVFPDLSIVKQEVDCEIEEHSYSENDSEWEKHRRPTAEDLYFETAPDEDDGASSLQYQQEDTGGSILEDLLVLGAVGQVPQPAGETPLEEEDEPPPEDLPTPGEAQLEEDTGVSPLDRLKEEIPAQDTKPLEEKQTTEEKPDSTTDLVVDITDISPSNSPLVTSSQSLIPSHEGSLKPELPLIGDKVDSDSNSNIPDAAKECYKDDDDHKVAESNGLAKGYIFEGYSVAEVKNNSEDNDKGHEAEGGCTVAASDYEEKCFHSYVSLENWGPFLDNSKCYCSECEILFATENAIAAHNMIDHSHLTEVSAASADDRLYGRKPDNTCDVCSSKFSSTSNLTKHKRLIHGNNVQNSSLTTRNGALQVGQIIMKKSELLSKKATESPSTSDNTPRSNVQTLGKFKPKAKTTSPIVTAKSNIKTTTSNDTSAQSAHHCQLCNTSLQTKEDLITHLYSHVSHKCNFCNALFTQKAMLEKHLWTHARSRHSSTSSMKEGGSSSSASVSPVKAAHNSAIDAVSSASQSKSDSTANEETSASRKNDMLKCHLCYQCFVSEQVYIRHMDIVHEKVVTSVPKSARVAEGDTYCKPCRREFPSVALYNSHTRQCHVTHTCVRCNKRIQGAGMFTRHKKECKVPIGAKSAQSNKNVAQSNKNFAQSNKNVQKVGTKLAKPTNSDLRVQFYYKCTICNTSFAKYRGGYRHLRRMHPNSERVGVIVRDMQKLVLKKAPPTSGAPSLIGRVINKTVGKSFTSNKYQSTITSEIDNMTMLNTVIRCPGCDTCFKKYANIKGHLASCSVRPEHYYRKCGICHMKFSNVPSTTEVHEFQHKNCDNLQVLDYDDYMNSLHKILYKCDKCDIYYTNLNSITAHFSSPDKRYTDCEICGYKIVAHKYAAHKKEHETYNLSRKDYIVIRFSHFTRQMKAVKRKLSPVRPLQQKLAVRTKTNGAANNKYTLIQCETCKHHFPGTGIIKHRRLGLKCKNKKFVVCQCCGLTFSPASLTPHMKSHEEGGVHLTPHDFSIVSSTRKPLAFNLKTAMSKLHECRCGLRAHREMYLCTGDECKDVGIRCVLCDLTFAKKTHVWHLKFHKMQAKSATATTEEESTEEGGQQQTDEKVASTKKPIVKTYIRCGKCKLHLRQDNLSLGTHANNDCSRIKRTVCLKCGLTFSKYTIMVHETLHKRSRTPLTMDNFRILRMSDLKPVKKELSSFPRCRKCGLCIDGCHSHHGKFKMCENDKSPKTTCQTCGMTFLANIYHLHLPYYGCGDAQKVTKIVRTEEIATVSKAVARVEEEIDVGQITKMMSKYNSMDQLWTELYQCDECKILVDSYDEIMKHCEDHRSAAFEVSAYMCHVCDLNFDSPSFKRHKEQHFSRPGLNRTNFEVIEFRPSFYRTVWWQFYKNAFTANKVTYKLKQEGPEQHTIYQCIDCKSFCSDKVAAYEHTVQERYCRSVSSTCSTCGLNVHEKCVAAHEDYHAEYPSLTARGFRIFWFCKIVENDQPELETQPAAVGTEQPQLYKCAACDLHFLNKKTAYNHYSGHLQGFVSDRPAPKSREDCLECGLSFTSISLLKHMSMHHKTARRHLTIETISTADMTVVGEIKVHALTNTQTNERREAIVQGSESGRNKSAADEKKPATLYKCTACKLHFIVRTTLLKHVLYDHGKSKTYKKVTCKYCNLAFSSWTLGKHRELHHVQSDCKAKDFRIVKLSPKVESPIEKAHCKLYKCADCGMHCLNTRAQRDHVRTCRYISKFDLIKCKDCQLTFLRHSMPSHRRTNCKQFTFDIQEFCPLKLNPQKISSGVPERREHALYKCSLCHVHYLSAKMINTHMSDNNHNLPKLVACSVCRVTFRQKSLTKHMIYHHEQLKLKLEDFTVIEVEPNIRQSIKRNKQVKEIPVNLPKRKKSKSTGKNVILYKCVVCNIFLLKRNTALNHITYKHKQMDPIRIRKCDRCNFTFSQVSLFHHKLLHKKCQNYTFKIVPVAPGENITTCERNAGIYTTEESKVASVSLISTRSPGDVNKDANETASNEQYENVEYLEENMDAESTVTKNSNGNMSSEESNGTSGEVKPIEEDQGSLMTVQLANGAVTKNSDGNFSSEESNGTGDEVKPDEEDQGSLMTVQLANKHICPKCEKVFDSNISKNLHMALDHLTDA